MQNSLQATAATSFAIQRNRLTNISSKLIDIVVGCTLAYSAVLHISNPFLFLESFLRYDLIGGYSALLLASVLMWMSLTVGLALVVGFGRRGALILAGCLFAIFTIAQLIALSRGMVIGCGCFGVEEQPIGFWTVLRSTSLLIASVISYVLGPSSESPIENP
jgi:uncharacterized membrane protein YphA (DoxX/SURF4 family)